jgi:two-component system LytT family sensor kinase
MYKNFNFIILLFLAFKISNGFAGESSISKDEKELSKKPKFIKVEVKQLYTEKSKIIKIDANQEMLEKLRSFEKQKINNEEKIKKLDQYIKICLNNNLNKPLPLAYFLMGNTYLELNQAKVALQFMELAMDSKFTNVLPFDYLLKIGSAHALLGNYELSNKFYKEFLSNKYETSKLNLQDSINLLIAKNYYLQKNYTTAIKLYESILQNALIKNYSENILAAYSGLAASYISNGQIDEGIKNYQMSLQKIASTKVVDDQKINESKELISGALRKQKLYKEEIVLRNTNTIKNKLNNNREYLKLAESYYNIEKYNEAIKLIDLFKKSPSFDLIDNSEIKIIPLLANKLKIKNPTKAVEYFSFYILLQDSIQSKIVQLNTKIGAFNGFENFLELEMLKKDKEISNNALQHLMQKETLNKTLVSRQKWIIVLLSCIILTGLLSALWILHIANQRKKANQRLALRSLRTQMNPHFIFNALNSVNSFISKNDEKLANLFLSDFARLMRLVMENSEHEFITLQKELEIIKIYLQLEHFRFENKFSYHLNIDDNLDLDNVNIPPMLVQPYIENAIWHGLRYKETKGNLWVHFAINDAVLEINIKDDGIGRIKSKEIKTANQKKSQSMALKNIQDRVAIINDLHKTKIKVEVTDLNTSQFDVGTFVKLTIPIL